MNYQEAIRHSLTVKWKTTPCQSGESCWCRVIEPEEEIKDEIKVYDFLQTLQEYNGCQVAITLKEEEPVEEKDEE